MFGSIDGMDGITASVSHHFVGPVYQSINTLVWISPFSSLALVLRFSLPFPSACSLLAWRKLSSSWIKACKRQTHTTGLSFFAMCHRHTEKPLLHMAKALPCVTFVGGTWQSLFVVGQRSKEHTAKSLSCAQQMAHDKSLFAGSCLPCSLCRVQ